MDINRFDVTVVIVSVIALISMTFAFPALGMTGDDEAEVADFPEFNVTDDRFDFAGEFPSNPGSPSTGTLEWIEDNPDRGINSHWFEGDSEEGVLLVISTVGPAGEDPELEIELIEFFDDGTTEDDNLTATFRGAADMLEQGDYQVFVEVTRFDGEEEDFEAAVQYEIRDQPAGGGFIGQIPVIGTVYDAAESQVQTLLWIGSVIYWFVAWMFTLVSNTLSIAVETTVFIISLFHWILSTWFGIISAAEGWSSIFILTPALLLMYVYVKLMILLVWVVWIG